MSIANGAVARLCVIDAAEREPGFLDRVNRDLAKQNRPQVALRPVRHGATPAPAGNQHVDNNPAPAAHDAAHPGVAGQFAGLSPVDLKRLVEQRERMRADLEKRVTISERDPRTAQRESMETFWAVRQETINSRKGFRDSAQSLRAAREVAAGSGRRQAVVQDLNQGAN